MCEVCVPANARILSIDRDEAGVALAVLSLRCILGQCDRIQALPRPDDEEGRLLLVHEPLFLSYSFPFSQRPHPLVIYSYQNLLSLPLYKFFSC